MSARERALADAVLAAHSLFERGKTAGSTANISVRVGDEIWISESGSCFGTLEPAQFALTTLDGTARGPRKPSKELTLHRLLYAKDRALGAVIHTHSFYATLWSCLPHPDPRDVVPAHTPYLGMKLGRIPLVPYAPPGSEALFEAFRQALGEENGYLLANHGPIVAAGSVMDAFYALEELEESARLAWMLRDCAQAIRIG